MRSIHTEVVIDAPAAIVWRHLIDVESYAEWNPFIHSQGVATVGATLVNTMNPLGKRPQVFRPRVLEVEPEKSFRWLGRLLLPGLFDGEHYFHLEPMSDGQTKFVHGEVFTGILVGPIMHFIGSETEVGFKNMNDALKSRAETDYKGDRAG